MQFNGEGESVNERCENDYITSMEKRKGPDSLTPKQCEMRRSESRAVCAWGWNGRKGHEEPQGVTDMYAISFKDFIYLFLVGGGRREKERERNIHQLPLRYTPHWDRTCNPGTCPDWESNRRPFAFQDNAQSTEPHWSGHIPTLS